MNLPPDYSEATPADCWRVAVELLDGLHEPAALVRTDGTIVETNLALRRRATGELRARNLQEITASDPVSFHRYLARCTASREPLLGALRFADGSHFTARGSRIQVNGEALVLLRLSQPDDRFVRLSETVKELNTLLRQREHEKAQLQEALNDRQLLHRELQHRVKNNMQMLAGLLHAARAEQENEAARDALGEALRRFAAVAAAHQSLYQLENLDAIAAGPLISEIARAALRASERQVELRTELADVQLSNDAAIPIALIVNELVTNALKHARSDQSPLELELRLTAEAGVAKLSVADNGTGFHAPSAWKRSSGLGLVRGLVRQLRGGIATDQVAGTRFTVSFPLGKSSRLETGS